MKRKPNINLAVFALGLALTGAGIGFVYWPAGMIAIGIILMAISLFGEKS